LRALSQLVVSAVVMILVSVAAVPAAADVGDRGEDLLLRKKCPKGLKKVVKRNGKRVCRRIKSPSQNPATPTTPPPPDLTTQILDDTYELATRYAQEASNSGQSLPRTYEYGINRNDCVLVGAERGRCTVFLSKLAYASGYGYGGYEAAIWRESFFATHVGNRLYSTRIVQIDYIDPYSWICSDTPRNGVPSCS
jgi:hypothetical protein